MADFAQEKFVLNVLPNENVLAVAGSIAKYLNQLQVSGPVSATQASCGCCAPKPVAC